MDTLSHGLYGGIVAGRKSKKNFLIAFFFGVLPDIFSFGPYFLLTIIGYYPLEHHTNGHPSPADIPLFVHAFYHVTHSIVIFGIIATALYILGKKKLLFLSIGWPLHILIDIPTHTHDFFPTPFLWPLSDFSINGISWAHPYIFVPNVVLLCGLYAYWYICSKKKKGI